MRLLNTTTYGLVEYAQIKKNDREYVILSHTWLEKHEEEVTYRDMECNLEGLRRGTYKQTGWRKLTDFCKFAANRGHKWAWMDTCCINKADAMETQASIHGMYEFYAEALVCYAYLADVSVEGGRDQYKAKLKGSRWFTRGWTLQELIAPNILVYLDQEWRHIGTRETFSDIPGLNRSFQRFLQLRITSVASQKSSLAYNLATRMSWAAQRRTMRPEDEAYSICGLLRIKLPVRYGDEDTTMAFLRLQLALIEMYHDLSILAWFSNPGTLLPMMALWATL
ncbi:Heterokaryon incompatibility [Penicillium samsonianum]|uniref:Heterokaryon incompatibility n=1 Tax=Penicillium samsonianum TaxID=1882272 RepID=UPI002546A9C2|nr:Heterokaryon incompatibility [Penicillium samsonianum]KAJ6138959.1 Heterokaryon incompatibility [Penicillium samsonianum]